MKKKFLIFVILITASTFASDRISRIIQSPTVLTRIEKFESEMKVDCIDPKEGQIHWMCTMTSCFLSLKITCVSRYDTFSSNDQITRLSLSGQEAAEGNFFIPASEFITEYKTLERK